MGLPFLSTFKELFFALLYPYHEGSSVTLSA